MTTYIEPVRPVDFVMHEVDGLSREAVWIPAGTPKFAPGMVLGRSLATAGATASAAAYGTNTASTGAMGAIAVGAAAKAGNYQLVVVEPFADAGTFVLTDPEGLTVGRGAVASAFSQGGLSFTLANGAADFVAGDGFTITVAGTENYIGYDGSGVARAIAMYPCDASAEAQQVTAIVRMAAVDYNQLSWHASADAAAKAKAVADLARHYVICRS